MADKQRRRQREAPATLADALGNHAATSGSQRQQTLARAASLLRMKPKMISGLSGRAGGFQLGGPSGAATAAAAVPSAMQPPPARRQVAGQALGVEEAQQSVHGGSTQVQSQRQDVRAASAPPQAQPAVSTHSSADGSDPAAGGQASGHAAGHAAGGLAAPPTQRQQWGGSSDPDSYFAKARSFLQQLAASRNGLRAEALATEPGLLLQKLEGGAQGLSGPSEEQQALQQLGRLLAPPKQQQQQAPGQRHVPAATNAQRASAKSCSGAASLGSKQPQQPIQGMWPPPVEGQRHSSRAAKQSGSITRFPPSSLQHRAGPPTLSSGSLLLPGSMVGGSFGGADGSRGSARHVQQQQQFAGLGGGWGLEEQGEEEADRPATGLGGSSRQCVPHYPPVRQALSGRNGSGTSPAWLATGGGDAAMDRLFAAVPSGSEGRWQEPGGKEAAGMPVGQLGAAGSGELDRLFRAAKRQRHQQGQQGQLAGGHELEHSWWGEEPVQAPAAGWDSTAPNDDCGAQQQESWQLRPGGRHGGQQQRWSVLGGEDPTFSPQPERAQQLHIGQQHLHGFLPAEERLPAFMAPSTRQKQRQQQEQHGSWEEEHGGWEVDELKHVAFGSSWGAASSGSDELPTFL